MEESLKRNLAKPVEAGQRLLDAMQEFADMLATLNPPDRSFLLEELRQSIENEPKLAKFFRELQIEFLKRGIQDIKTKVTQAKTKNRKPKP